MSVKHFLAEDQDTHDEVIVLGPAGKHKIEELERDLFAVRHDYHELGQRASALASERDAVATGLDSAKADAESARAQLAALQAQHDTLAAQLETRLRSQQAELQQERDQRQHLEAQLAQSNQGIEALQEQLEQAQQLRDNEIVVQLDALDQQLAATRNEKSSLEAKQETLLFELEQAQKTSASAQEFARELEASLAAAIAHQHSSDARAAELEQQNNTLASELEQAREGFANAQEQTRKQIADLERRRADLEAAHATALEQASELEAALTTASERQQSTETRATELEQQRDALASELEQARNAAANIQEQARTQIADLERHGVELQVRHAKALEQASELEASLATVSERQHSSEARVAELEQQHSALVSELKQVQAASASAHQQALEKIARLEQQRNTLTSALEQTREASASAHNQAQEQIAQLEQSRAELEAEHAKALADTRQLEASLTAATGQQHSGQARVAELEQTLQEQRNTLEAELANAHAALTRARAEQEHTLGEQSRLMDTVSRVEQQLAEAERLHERERAQAAQDIASAEKAQRTMGEKVRQLAEQLHEQHQQQDKLEQRARDHGSAEASLRTEFERESSRLQAEVLRLQQELERHRSGADRDGQAQADGAAAPQHDFSGGPNSWKTVAGVSLLLGTVATATAYWNSPQSGHEGIATDTAVSSQPGHAVAFPVAEVRERPAPDASALPAPPAPDRQPTATATSADAARHGEDPATIPAPPGGDRQLAATSSRTSSHTRVSQALKRTARESLRSLDDPLTASSGEPEGDPLIRQQQNNLIALGFDLGEARADGVKGKRTRQALSEFRQYYLPVAGLEDVADDQQLASLVNVFAAIARDDQQAFGIDNEVLTAIRLGSLRTGMDFPYLMELAYTESSFNPAKKARRSSATGLYQFTDSTWLHSIKTHGKKYGLGLYAAQINYSVDGNGYQRPGVDNPLVHRHILALRYDPRIATLMAAEFALQNKRRLTRSGTEFGRTELYLAHFFGTDDALKFLRLLEKDPGGSATELFPKAAQSNPGVFEPWEGQQRTMQEVYNFFAAKFDTGRYEILNPGLALLQETEQ